MPEHRRLNLTARSRRMRRVPAYQLQRTVRSTGATGRPTGTPPFSDGGAAPSPDVDDELVTLTTSSNGPAADLDPAALTIESDHDDSTNGAAAISSERSDPVGDDSDDTDYEAYARGLEEAAARNRAEAAPVASATTAAFPAIEQGAVEPDVVARPRPGRPRPHSGGRGRGGTRGPRGRAAARREPDPRPLLKRPRTWLLGAAALVGISILVVTVWILNLLHVTYNAYNQAHIDPTERPVWTINPEGTPVPVPTEQVQQSLPSWDNRDPVNILLLGIDERPGDEEPARSDTMIVMRIDPTTSQVTMMSIPRDLLVDIPGYGSDKINAAFPLAELEQEGSGPSLVAQTIEYNFDIRIHYFVTIDFSGFRTVVDTIGGVIIDVPAPVKDDQYPTEEFGITRQYFSTGLQKMDGETALRYSRTRHGDNDIARGDRQQQMLVAIRQQAISLGLITQADDLIRQFGDSVRTDLNFNQMLALSNLGRGIDPGNIIQVNLWTEGLLWEHSPEYEGDAFYMEGDWGGIYALVDYYFPAGSAGVVSTPTPGPSPIADETDGTGGADVGPEPGTSVDPEATESDATTEPDEPADVSQPDLTIPVIVQNASSVELMATSVTQLLYDVGFDTVTPELGSETVEFTAIYDYVGSPETAAYIAMQLGIDASAIVPGSGGTGIVVVVGEDLAASLTTDQ